ncbi:MAG: fibronectin type III-like domain-contianing protein [Butyrivibrio sp.]|nr:fibronectin type III-like domain-contianing protein [Butyrivibrio sp.]
MISKDTFGRRNAEYRESIYVGYRFYDKAEKELRFPFGHGLSYTRFTYSGLEIDGRTVTATVTNTGSVSGAEIVQLYIAPPQDNRHRPVQELKDFVRLELQPGESRRVSFTLDDRSFAVWADGWKVPAGSYEVRIAASSRDIRLTGRIEISGQKLSVPVWQQGSWYETMNGIPSRAEWEQVMGHPVMQNEKPLKGMFTLDNTCIEMKEHSLIMKIQYKVTENIIAKSFDGKKDYSDPSFRVMMVCAVDCPLRATVILAGGSMSDSVAQGLLHMANGHFFKGIAAMLKK